MTTQESPGVRQFQGPKRRFANALPAEKIALRKIQTNIPEDVIQADLERYRLKAIELGAADAKVIPAGDVQPEEWVRLKCLHPRCSQAGRCLNCPPNTLEPEFMRKALSTYRWAVLVRNDVEPTSDFGGTFGGTRPSPARGEDRAGAHFGKNNEIISAIECLAFSEGYYLAVAFAGGPCRIYLCTGQECQGLQSGHCRYREIARPAMEGVGLDAFGACAKVGWDVYPLGQHGIGLLSGEVDQSSIGCAVTVSICYVC